MADIVGALEPSDRLIHYAIDELYEELHAARTSAERTALRQRVIAIKSRVQAVEDMALIMDELASGGLAPPWERELRTQLIRGVERES